MIFDPLIRANAGFDPLMTEVGEFFTSLFGGFDTMLMTLIIVIIIDYVTAVFRAIYLKKLSSSLCLNGIIRKLLYLIIVIFSVAVEKLLAGEVPLREITIMFFVANEGLSILENARDIIPMPEKLRSTLEMILSKTHLNSRKSPVTEGELSEDEEDETEKLGEQ